MYVRALPVSARVDGTGFDDRYRPPRPRPRLGIEIHITTEGHDTVVVGYGESAEPALLQIKPQRKVENVQKFDSRVPATSFGQ